MNNFDSEEEVLKRKNQEDPLIMYLIVRESLNMSAGKIAAQCAHAAQMILLNYMEFQKMEYESNISSLPPFNGETFELITNWLNHSFRKVVLRAKDSEWEKIRLEFGEKKRVLVIDAGLTQVEPGSETVIGLYPMRKSKAPKLIKRLQLF